MNQTGGEHHTIVRRLGDVLEIRLNRPEVRNALSVDMMRGVTAALEGIKHNSGVRAVLLTSSGISFCAGGDVRQQRQQAGRRRAIDVRHRMMTVAYPMMRELVGAQVPVVAAVQGHAYGAGFSLALAADIVIASERATFCQAFVHRGLVPDLASTLLLPKAVGHHRALQLMMSGRPITAATGHELGFVTEVVPPEQLAERAMRCAEDLAAGPTTALGLMKQLASAEVIARLETTMQAEAAGQAFCVETDDHREGVAAFAEKRDPVFRGT